MTKKTSRRKKKNRSWRWELPFDRALVYLLAFFAFAMPLFIWPGITEYGYAKSIFTLVGVSILLILWGGSFLSRKEWRLRLPWITFPVLGVVVVSLLSLLGATNGRVVVQSLTLVVFFFLFALVVSNVVKEKRDVTLILYALLLSAFFASLYGLLQYLGVMRGATGRPGLGEVISTMGNRNYLGGFLSYLLFPAVVLIVRLRSRILRALVIGLLSFNFGMIMLVQQTGTKVALVGGVVALLIAWAIFRPIEPIRRNRSWLLALLFVLVFTFLVEAPSGPLNSVVGLSADNRSLLGRLWDINADKVRTWDWWVGWEMFKDHPFVGVGLGNYKLNFIPYKAKFLATPLGIGYDFYIARAAQAHNEYVQVVAELGVLGILATLALLGAIPITFWRRLRRNTDEGDRLDLILFGCGIVVFLLHALVSFPAHLPASSLVVVLVFGLASSRAYGDAAEVAVCLKGWSQKAVIGILAALCVVVSVVAARDYSADRLLNRGVMQLQMGQLRLAEATFEESASRDFCPRQVYYHLATVKIRQGRYEEARADLEKCLSRFVVEQVYLNLANLAVNLGDLETAQKNVELLLSTHPHPELTIQARYLNGTIAARGGDYNRAIDELEALVSEHPYFERSYIALAELYRFRGMLVNARKCYEKALEIIEPRLTNAQAKLSSVNTISAEEYSKLRNEIEFLTQEKETVERGLAALPLVEDLGTDVQPLSYHLDDVRDAPDEERVGFVGLIADVVLERVGVLTDSQLIDIAGEAVNDIVSARTREEARVDEITVAFWWPETIGDKKTPAASVIWAPEGEWEGGTDTARGEYARYFYRVSVNDTANQSLPSYRLDDIRDVSAGECVKLIADVVLEDPGALTDDQLIEIARQTVNDIVSSKAVNAITVAFWRPETIADKKTPAASVDWAPDGEWDKAETVALGNYSSHSYWVNANDTVKW